MRPSGEKSGGVAEWNVNQEVGRLDSRKSVFVLKSYSQNMKINPRDETECKGLGERAGVPEFGSGSRAGPRTSEYNVLPTCKTVRFSHMIAGSEKQRR